MKRVLVFLVLLAGGVGLSAWVGLADGRQDALEQRAQLNTSKQRHGLNDGEILVWAPDGGAPPPGVASPPTGAAQPRRSRANNPQSGPQRYVAAQPGGSALDSYSATRQLLPLAKPLPAPRKGDWRGQIQEPAQSFDTFLHEARRARGKLVILPLGDMPGDQMRAIDHVADAMSAFFGMQVVRAPALALERLPKTCFRNLSGGKRQLNAEAFMRLILRPSVGGDVASVVAVTALDIYPGEEWPFESAFGWSSFSGGTSVISTSQVVSGRGADRGKNLLRLSKLATHELAHTFGLKHCSTHDCLMNGCSSLRENDSKPFHLCPDCLAKLSYALSSDPAAHLEDMLALCQNKGFSGESKYYVKALERIR